MDGVLTIVIDDVQPKHIDHNQSNPDLRILMGEHEIVGYASMNIAYSVV